MTKKLSNNVPINKINADSISELATSLTESLSVSEDIPVSIEKKPKRTYNKKKKEEGSLEIKPKRAYTKRTTKKSDVKIDELAKPKRTYTKRTIKNPDVETSEHTEDVKIEEPEKLKRTYTKRKTEKNEEVLSDISLVTEQKPKKDEENKHEKIEELETKQDKSTEDTAAEIQALFNILKKSIQEDKDDTSTEDQAAREERAKATSALIRELFNKIALDTGRPKKYKETIDLYEDFYFYNYNDKTVKILAEDNETLERCEDFYSELDKIAIVDENGYKEDLESLFNEHCDVIINKNPMNAGFRMDKANFDFTVKLFIIELFKSRGEIQIAEKLQRTLEIECDGI
jgi:hypothetical protein